MDNKRSSFPEGEQLSTSDMHDFSISSMISNVSSLLRGNNSSFLVHVDAARRSTSPGGLNISRSKNNNTNANSGFSGRYDDSAVFGEDTFTDSAAAPCLSSHFVSSPEEQLAFEANTDYSVTDIMKGMYSHPSSYRFPPPPLSAILERSCEDVSISSKSRASSAFSDVQAGGKQRSKKHATSTKIPAPVINDQQSIATLVQNLEKSNRAFNMNSPSAMLNTDPDIECPRSDEAADSWDEFDKIMDKSLPPKEWEIQEFEELSHYKSKSMLEQQADSFDYVSSEEAKLLMDREEADREQFLKSPGASFASSSGRNSAEPILSMTNYFQHRSSFPVDNIANESSMFQDEASFAEKTVRRNAFCDDSSKDITVTNFSMPASFETMDLDSIPGLSPQVTKNLDPKTKNLANFLMGSESNGIEKSSIMEYIMNMCKRRSSIGVSANCSTPNNIEESQNAAESQVSEIQELSQVVNGKRVTNSSQKMHPPKENTTKIDANLPKKLEQTQTSTKLNAGDSQRFEKHHNDKLVRANSYKNSKLNKVSFSDNLTEPSKNAAANWPTENEIDKSILISEPGKLALCDDIDISKNGFDDFKRHLSNNEEKSKPISAFVHPSSIAQTDSSKTENVMRRSANNLRKSALSPPEKLISRELLLNKSQPLVSTSTSNQSFTQNHSTPIGTVETMSAQIARQMRMEEANISSSLKNKKAETKETNHEIFSKENFAPVVQSGVITHSTPVSGSVLTSKNERVPENVPREDNNKQGQSKQVESFSSVEIARIGSSKHSSIISSQPPPTDKSELLCNAKTNAPTPTEERKVRESLNTMTHPSTVTSHNFDSMENQQNIPPHTHGMGAYTQQNPSWYPPSYGMPISIHIHLPHHQMPYGPHPDQSRFDTNFPSSNVNAPFSSMCNCHHAGHKK